MPNRRALAGALLALSLVSTGRVAHAWELRGHMATGIVVHDVLRRADPRVVAAIVRLMRAHPDSARFAHALGPLTGEARDRRLFAFMARWPDDIRESSYDRPKWHYDLAVVSGFGSVLPFRAGEASDAFARNLAVARDPRAPAGDRAIALCWLFHVVGDMHQPLHAGHALSLRFLHTDRAGTVAWVRAEGGTPAVTLHQFWDAAGDLTAIGAPPSDTVEAARLASRLQRDLPPDRLAPALARTPLDGAAAVERFAEWMEESERLAEEVVYRGPALDAARERGGAPALGAAYVATVRELSAKRMALASYRLAALLRTLPR